MECHYALCMIHSIMASFHDIPSIFDQITVSPLAVNVELLVVEQLISLAEKEIALIQSSAPIRELETMHELEELERGPGKEQLHHPPAEKEESLIIWLPTPAAVSVPFGIIPPIHSKSFGGLQSAPGELDQQQHQPITTSITSLHSFTWRDQPMIDPVTKAQLLLPGGTTDGLLANQKRVVEHQYHHLGRIRQSALSPLLGDKTEPPVGLHVSHRQAHEPTNITPPCIPDLELVDSQVQETEAPGFIIPLKSIVEMLEGQAVYQTKMNRSWERHGASRLQSEIDALVTAGVQDMLQSYQILTTASADESACLQAKLKNRPQSTAKGLRQEAQRLFESKFEILFLPPTSSFSHWLIFPMPRLVENSHGITRGSTPQS